MTTLPGRRELAFTSVLIWLLLLLCNGSPAFGEEFVRTKFDYNSMGKKPYEDCSASQLETLRTVDQQVDRLQSNNAVEIAKKIYVSPTKCPRVYEAYGWSLFRNGKWREAISAIDEGIKRFGAYPGLIERRAYISLEMAELGTSRQMVDGNSIYKPRGKGLPFDEKQFKEENYRCALGDFLYLSDSNPERYENTFIAAHIYSQLGEFEKSTNLFKKMVDADLYKDKALAGMAQNYLQTKQYAAAEKVLLQAQNGYPRSSEIYQQLSRLYIETGEPAKAKGAEQKANFYGSVPPFTSLEYSDDSYKMIAFFMENNPVKEKRKQLAKVVEGADKELSIDLCLTILAVHANHGNGLEEQATQDLIRFGKAAVPKTIQLLKSNGVSTCAITNAAEVLAAVKDERGWQALVDCMPSMARLPGSLMPPFIPDKIIQFDRERGVKVLLPFIRDMIRTDQNGDGSKDPAKDFGKSMIYFAFYHPLKSFDKTELQKMASGLGYTEKESQILLKGVYEK